MLEVSLGVSVLYSPLLHFKVTRVRCTQRYDLGYFESAILSHMSRIEGLKVNQ